MSRKIVNRQASITTLTPDKSDMFAWLTTLPGGESAWLLAHADDGVIWGKIENENLTTAYEARFTSSPPPLRIETLQQARIFNDRAEWLLWRDGTTGEWRTRVIEDRPDGTDFAEAFDESHMLWGDSIEASAKGFTLMRDGAQELFHAVPLTGVHPGHSLRLKVRYYVKEDQSGFVSVAASRLVELYSERGQR